MHTIDVHDLPEPMANAIAQTVQALREQLQKNGENHVDLPLWPLGSAHPLSREEIYNDHLDRKLGTGPH